MPSGDVHVLYRRDKDKWAVKVEGRLRVSSFHATKIQAVNVGRATAEATGAELLIHRPVQADPPSESLEEVLNELQQQARLARRRAKRTSPNQRS